MTTSNHQLALGLISSDYLDAFYSAAQESQVKDATAPTSWGQQELQNIKDINQLTSWLIQRLPNFTDDPNAEVSIVTDDQFIAQMGKSPQDLTSELNHAFFGKVNNIHIGTNNDPTTVKNDIISQITGAIKNQ